MNMSTFTNVTEMKYWCYKVLPLVYDDSLSYYEVLCKATEKLNEVIENNNNIPEYIKEIVSSGGFLSGLQEQIAKLNDGDSKTATADRHTGELIWLDGTLYRITRNMLAGDQYVTSSEGVTGNIEKLTFEEWCERYRGLIKDSISSHDEKYNEESSASYNVGDWLWWQGAFYTVTKVIAKDDKLVAGRNVQLDNLENILVQTIKDIQSDIANEKTERQEADNKLSSDLATETSNREDADSQLSASITQEITDRTSAINTVNEALATETKNREDADAQLTASITQEIADRTALITDEEQLAYIPKTLKYSKPSAYNNYFNSVKMTDTEGNAYDVLTAPEGGIDIKSTAERRYVFMADSYGDFHSSIDDKDHGWPREVIAMLGLTSDNSYDFSMGSRGFAYNPVVGTFEDGLKQAISSISSPGTITDLIVCGGTNDMVGLQQGKITTTELDNAIKSFVTYAKSVLPNANIRIGFNGFIIYHIYATPFINALYSYRKCVLYGASYIANMEWTLANKIYHDDAHPTPDGFTKLDEAVIQAIYTGQCDIIRDPVAPTFTFVGNITLNLNSLYVSQHNEIATIENEVQGIGFTVGNDSITLTTLKNFTKIAKITNWCITTKQSIPKTFFSAPTTLLMMDGNILIVPVAYGILSDEESTWLVVSIIPSTSLTFCYGTTSSGTLTATAKDFSSVNIHTLFLPIFCASVPLLPVL